MKHTALIAAMFYAGLLLSPAVAAQTDCTDSKGVRICTRPNGMTETYWDYKPTSKTTFTIHSKVFMPFAMTTTANVIIDASLKVDCTARKATFSSIDAVTDGLDTDNLFEKVLKNNTVGTSQQFLESDQFTVYCSRLTSSKALKKPVRRSTRRRRAR